MPHSPDCIRICHWLLIFIRHCVAGKNTGGIKGGSFLAGILSLASFLHRGVLMHKPKVSSSLHVVARCFWKTLKQQSYLCALPCDFTPMPASKCSSSMNPINSPPISEQRISTAAFWNSSCSIWITVLAFRRAQLHRHLLRLISSCSCDLFFTQNSCGRKQPSMFCQYRPRDGRIQCSPLFLWLQ